MSEPSKKPLSMTVTIQTPRALTTGKDTATKLKIPCSVVPQEPKKEGAK
jgi:hypothetical protein